LTSLLNEYNSSQDKFHVHEEFMGRYDILEQKIIASVMAGKTPDIAQMYEGVTMLLTRDEGEESLQNLSPYIKDWDGFTDLFEVLQRNSTYGDGKVYSLPFNKSFPVLMYNKRVLSLVGWERPPKSWNELAAISALVQSKVVFDPDKRRPVLRSQSGDSRDPVGGYAFSIDPWLFEIMLLQSGGAMTNKEETKVLFDSEVSVDSLMWFVNAISKGWGYRTQGYDHQNDFGAQKVAFIITSSVSQKFMANKLNFPYGVAAVPGGEKRDVSILSGTNVCLFSGIGEERSRGAWDFIKWFNSPEITARWAMNTFYVPTRRASLKLPKMQKYMREVEGGRAGIEQLKIGDMEPRSSAWYRCRIILRSAMEKIISIVEKGGETSKIRKMVQENLSDAAKRMNRELAKYSL
ncbi:ABC transporter substrate-binding protein, partial [bacterium]|nr:ABC transporter substrate-binding protein [bacterium]